MFVSLGDGEPRFRARVLDMHANTPGFAHGGYLAAVLDAAVGQGTRRIRGDRTGCSAVPHAAEHHAGPPDPVHIPTVVAGRRGHRGAAAALARLGDGHGDYAPAAPGTHPLRRGGR